MQNVNSVVLSNINSLNKRRHPDLNWGIKDLQSIALPLGYVAITARNQI